MARPIVLNSFEDLAPFFGLARPSEETVEGAAESPAPPVTPVTPAEPVPAAQDGAPALPTLHQAPAGTGGDLAELLAELETASATLATVARQDQEVRALALCELEQYDRLVAEQRAAERACERSRVVRQEAEALAAGAFAEEARAAAGRVAAVVTRAEAAAVAAAGRRRQLAERLASELDLERLLDERRRQEATEQAKAAQAGRAGRLSGALAGARAALAAGRIEEASALLGPIAMEHPDDADVASLINIVAQHAQHVKAEAAEDALWATRRELRRDPAAAVARLQALDVHGLPEPLARQVFGAWAEACARLCHDRGMVEALRYAPDPGCGAVIARDQPGGPHVVVGALGLGPEWRPGAAVSERYVRRARPLR